MKAEAEIESHALEYEQLIRSKLNDAQFDLILLGMGDDGHTASLFPKTHGLHAESRLVIANFVPKLNTWRMSFTFECINNAHNITITVLGKEKREVVKRVLSEPYTPDLLPSQAVGTPEHKALWILDNEAGDLKS
jgi:6-phosphogluconolactonase